MQYEALLIEFAFEDDLDLLIGPSDNPKLEAIKNHLRQPLGNDLDRILRYETTVHRQLIPAINQLERLQRMRTGENIPAPVNVRLSDDR